MAIWMTGKSLAAWMPDETSDWLAAWLAVVRERRTGEEERGGKERRAQRQTEFITVNSERQCDRPRGGKDRKKLGVT